VETAKQCKPFFGELLVIDKTQEIMLRIKPQSKDQVLAKVKPFPALAADKITLCKHPQKSDRLLLNLPKVLLETHLEKVKNIHGRRWNAEYIAWEVPYTQLTIRFVKQ
jgi:hypothetical protein